MYNNCTLSKIWPEYRLLCLGQHLAMLMCYIWGPYYGHQTVIDIVHGKSLTHCTILYPEYDSLEILNAMWLIYILILIFIMMIDKNENNFKH